MMEVILLRDVEKLGKRGEVVNVRDGFGRNFLLPRSLAIAATRSNRAFLEAQKKRTAKRLTEKKEEAEETAERLKSVRLRLEMAVGEKDKLFGAVTAQDLAEALRERGFNLDKKQIRLPEPIRSLGTHTVIVELNSDVKPTLQVEVVKVADKAARKKA